MNDSPVGCQTRAVTEPQRDGGICEANDGEVFKTATFKPLSRARKERAPGIPRGMMRGKCAHWLAMTRLFWICPLRRGRADRGDRPYKRCDAKSQKRADEGIGPYKRGWET